MQALNIDPKLIKPNPYQPRKHFDPIELEQLAASIKKYGILQPLVVEKEDNEFELIVGERRLKAALMLGLESVPVIVREKEQNTPYQSKLGTGQAEKLEIALIENIQRQDLNPIERGKAFKQLAEEFNLTHDEIARRVGISRTAVTNTIRLLSLAPEVQDAIIRGKVSEGHGKVLAAITDPKKQKELAEKIAGQSLSVRVIERAVQKMKPERRAADFAFEEKEEILAERLATRVKIEVKRNRKEGKIIIDFWSPEELNEIVRKIVK